MKRQTSLRKQAKFSRRILSSSLEFSDLHCLINTLVMHLITFQEPLQIPQSKMQHWLLFSLVKNLPVTSQSIYKNNVTLTHPHLFLGQQHWCRFQGQWVLWNQVEAAQWCHELSHPCLIHLQLSEPINFDKKYYINWSPFTGILTTEKNLISTNENLRQFYMCLRSPISCWHITCSILKCHE